METMNVLRYVFGGLAGLTVLLAVIQHFNFYNFYGGASNKWVFWCLIMAAFVIGIAGAAWTFNKKKT